MYRLIVACLCMGAVLAAECVYVTPRGVEDGAFFSELVVMSRKEPFEDPLAMVEGGQGVYRFEFRYLIPEEVSAEDFFKVMLVKGQEADRFVPPIASSTVVAPGHLGYVRQIQIRGGPLVQEHVLVDRGRRMLLFIEEWNRMGDQTQAGAFAAVNRLERRDGRNYFTGTYVYPTVSSPEEVEARCQMFETTFNNMVEFARSGELAAAYRQLKSY
jgi:hypothetical protein